MTRVIASIEARMGSSRLPGKMLMDIAGKPTLARVVDRLRRCEKLDGIVLATTTAKADDVLAQWAEDYQVTCYRGSEEDVLNRVVCAHQLMETDVIVEVTGDCPLLDPDVIDMGVAAFFENECDVVNNVKVPSYPQGVDLQVFPFKLLEDVEQRVNDPAVREHVSLHFYENEDQYRLFNVMAPSRCTAPELRFQLDYPEDLTFIRSVYERLEPDHGGDGFGVAEVMALLEREPDLKEINAHCAEKAVR